MQNEGQLSFSSFVQRYFGDISVEIKFLVKLSNKLSLKSSRTETKFLLIVFTSFFPFIYPLKSFRIYLIIFLSLIYLILKHEKFDAKLVVAN